MGEPFSFRVACVVQAQMGFLATGDRSPPQPDPWMFERRWRRVGIPCWSLFNGDVLAHEIG